MASVSSVVRLLLCLLLAPFGVSAQGRTAGPDTLTSRFEVGGLTVILRRNAASEVVAANLYLLGGTRQAPPAAVGIEPFILAASERGTRRYSREALRSALARTGSTITVEPAEDWTMVGLRAVRATLDSSWALFADRVAAPRLDSADVELVRAQLVGAARQRLDSPDARLSALADSVTFAGHPYALDPAGTPRTLAGLGVAALPRYHAEQFVTSRMLLVVVGNVDRAHVERLVLGTLGRLPRGTYRWAPPPPPAAGAAPGAFATAARAVVFDQRPLPTNYLLGYYVGPPSSSPDYQAVRVAQAVLSGRLFSEIRVRRNLTYAVDAPFVDRAVTAGGLYVTTVAPDTTLALMREAVERLRRETVDPVGLRRLVGQFITEYFLANETNAEQANFLARAELYRGDYRVATRFVDELRAVTPEDVRRVAQRYMNGIRWAVVGDSTSMSRRSFF